MIRAESICLRIGDFFLNRASLEVRPGEYFVLLGPPGSGKTLFLEALCGLRKFESGRLFIHEKNVTDLEPRGRMIGYVPQDYALFPHRLVEGNIRFGLEAKKLPVPEMDRRVEEIACQLNIRHLLHRRIGGLSGGERQQVALGRALVIQPKVLLLDEPVSALDESTRESVCRELKRLQGKLGVTTIHVCHQLQEAFSVADRAGILKDGEFQQVDTMKELMQKPCNRFVAEFMQCQNIIPAHTCSPSVQSGTTEIEAGIHRFTVPGKYDGALQLVIRPERMQLERPNSVASDSIIRLPAKIKGIEELGGYARIELDASFPLVVHASHDDTAGIELSAGATVAALIRPENIHILSQT
jgi:ABC-type sugar transport system ATPase subunit